MKKWYVIALIACVAVAAQAADGQGDAGKKKGKGRATTLENYLKWQKASAEKKGVAFDQAKMEARFKKLDTNQDGVLSAEEKAKGRGGKKGRKGKKGGE